MARWKKYEAFKSNLAIIYLDKQSQRLAVWWDGQVRARRVLATFGILTGDLSRKEKEVRVHSDVPSEGKQGVEI